MESNSQNNRQYLERLLSIEGQDATYHCIKDPLVMQRGKGSLVWDVEGREYIDLCAGFGVMALGHASVPLTKVMKSMVPDHLGTSPLIHGMGDVYPSSAKVELLEAMKKVLPSYLSKGILALTGAQAVEIAVKTALLKTKKSGFIAFEGAYHGLDLGILPLTSRADFREPFRDWICEKNVIRLPYGCSQAELENGHRQLQKNGLELAAIIVEPIQGRAGIVEPPLGWLASLRNFTLQQQALLIFDEVFTGLGRIGTYTSATEVPADLICLGKALGGGMPLSACFGSNDAMSGWPLNNGEAIHTGTFFGHPMACQVGKETLDELHRNDWPAKVQQRSKNILDYLHAEIGEHPKVLSIRGRGYFIGIEFKGGPGAGAEMMDELRRRGVIALASGSVGQGISMTPAFNIDLDLWKKAVQIMKSTLDQIHSNK